MTSFVGIDLVTGLAGQVSRAQGTDCTIETYAVQKGQVIEYGTIVDITSDGLITKGADGKGVGVVVRDFHQEGANGQKLFGVLTRGFVWALSDAGVHNNDTVCSGADGKAKTGAGLGRAKCDAKNGLVELAWNI